MRKKVSLRQKLEVYLRGIKCKRRLLIGLPRMNPALFREGTSDKNVWENVVDRNEYRLPDQFEPNSLCLDIGANIGAFSYACIQRGAAKVIAFEPDPDNFALFRKQLKAEIADGRVEVYPLAVVGGSGFSWRTFSGVVAKDGEVNHGGAFLFSEEGSDFGLGQYIVNRPFKVPCIGILEAMNLIPSGVTPRLLKMDCEGSEWGIIHSNSEYTREGCGRLNCWQQIVGEYHPNGEGDPKAMGLYLKEHNVELVPHPNSELGLFFATRK